MSEDHDGTADTPKLLHRIATEGASSAIPTDNPLSVHLRDLMRSCMVIVADGAIGGFLAKWMGEDNCFSEDPKDIENIAPPFSHYWIESSMRLGNARAGALFRVHGPPTEFGWDVHAFLAYGFKGQRVIFPFTCVSYNVNPDGQLGDRWDIYSMPGVVSHEMTQEDFARNVFSPFMAVHTLMHCKNISLAEHAMGAEANRRMAKRFGDRDGGYRFHTLRIQQACGRSRSAFGGETDVMPLHVCRGHYAKYGPEYGRGLLFGKYAGRFWVETHARGNEKNGVVDKDYAVKA